MHACPKTLVTLCTYNEIENLPRLVEQILAQLPEANVLVVDDNSPDGTGQWCDERAQQEPRVKCVHRPAKLGLGTAHITAMKYALDQGYDQVVTMDADFSHDPRYLPELLRQMDAPGERPVAVSIGSRYVPGGGVTGWPMKRHFMSRSVNLAARILLGLSPRDCSGAYRCYRCINLARLDFDNFRSHGYVFQEEVLWHIKRNGGRFVEFPIVFANRMQGASKIDGSAVGEAILVLLQLGWRNWTGR
ncbi:MAG: polyprenol monophosphomannose synthase [Pirellulales bacterium]|nr:polyprenol monophosphomannose synthase [Pirellulales bacterium]